MEKLPNPYSQNILRAYSQKILALKYSNTKTGYRAVLRNY